MGNILTDSAKLLVKLRGQGSRSIDLTADTFTIGRKPDNDLPIDDHTVSSRHAKIVRVQSVYFLEDLKSTNGTAVNGKPVERAQLHDADVITIGQHRIIFQDNAPSRCGISIRLVGFGPNHGDLRQTSLPCAIDHGQGRDHFGEDRPLGVPSHENGEPDWIAGRRDDPPDRMVRTQGGGPDFDSWKRFHHQPFRGKQAAAGQRKRRIRAAGIEGWGCD